MTDKLTPNDLTAMVAHWIKTPPNGYLGDDYGCDYLSLLMNPMAVGVGDAFIAKMKKDIPLLQGQDRGTINVYFRDIDGSNDSKKLIIDIAGNELVIDENGNIS